MLTGMLAEAWDLYRRSAANSPTISFVPYVLTAVIVMPLNYARRPRYRACVLAGGQGQRNPSGPAARRGCVLAARAPCPVQAACVARRPG